MVVDGEEVVVGPSVIRRLISNLLWRILCSGLSVSDLKFYDLCVQKF